MTSHSCPNKQLEEEKEKEWCEGMLRKLHFLSCLFQSLFIYLIENCCLLLTIGLREWFAQTDERGAPPRIPVMVNMASSSVSSKKTQKMDELSVPSAPSLDQINSASRNSVLMDEYSDEDEEQMPEAEQEVLSYRYLLFVFFV